MPFHLRQQRWACLVAHRRAGKTVCCIGDILTRALATKKKYGRYAYIAPYYTQAEEAAWDYMQRYGDGIIVDTNKSKLTVELNNGSKIRICGADNPKSLRGTYLDGVILDEYADMRPTVWGEVIRPMLADRQGWAVFIGTPRGHNAFYKIHQRSITEDRWYSLTLRASESKILTANELVESSRDMTENQYEQEFECSFEACITGAIYGKQMADAKKEGRFVGDLYDPELPVHTAWDLGYDDYTSIWFWQISNGEIRLIDFYEDSFQDIEHYCGVVKQKKYNYGKHYVPHDGAIKTLQAGGRSIVQQAYKLGVKMYVVAATSQQNGIEAARFTLKSTWFDKIKCKDGIESMQMYHSKWDDDRGRAKSTPHHDWSSHAADAFEIIGQVWRNPKELEVKKKPRFLEDLTADEIFWGKNA